MIFSRNLQVKNLNKSKIRQALVINTYSESILKTD
jgi:hypothetical protein